MKKMILCCLVAVLGCGVFAVEAKTPQKKGEIVTTVFTVDIAVSYTHLTLPTT